jgi:hypothetical protein
VLDNVPSFGDSLKALNVVMNLTFLHVGLYDSANLKERKEKLEKADTQMNR